MLSTFSLQLHIEDRRRLCAGKRTCGVKTVAFFAIDDTIGPGPIHSSLRIVGNAGLIRKILAVSGGGASGVPPEDGRHLLPGYRIVRSKNTSAIAGHHPICRCPGGGAGIDAPSLNVRKRSAAGNSRASLRPIARGISMGVYFSTSIGL